MSDRATIEIDGESGGIAVRHEPTPVDQFGVQEISTSRAKLIAVVALPIIAEIAKLSDEDLKVRYLAQLGGL